VQRGPGSGGRLADAPGRDGRAHVLRINIATVIGPTPPGTGVMYEARSLAVSNSTSPASLPLSSRLIPTSITTAPDLIHSPLTK